MKPKKKPKPMYWMACSLALFLGGCGSLNPFGETEQYAVSLSASGTVPVAPTSLGKLSVPTNGVGLLNVAVALAGQHLAQEKQLKFCKFSSFPPELDAGRITLTASAICQYQGQQVNETIALVLMPVTS